MATHSSVFAGKFHGQEETGGLQSTGLQRIRHDLVTKHEKILPEFKGSAKGEPPTSPLVPQTFSIYPAQLTFPHPSSHKLARVSVKFSAKTLLLQCGHWSPPLVCPAGGHFLRGLSCCHVCPPGVSPRRARGRIQHGNHPGHEQVQVQGSQGGRGRHRAGLDTVVQADVTCCPNFVTQSLCFLIWSVVALMEENNVLVVD